MTAGAYPMGPPGSAIATSYAKAIERSKGARVAGN
jgi:hypothetical protein